MTQDSVLVEIRMFNDSEPDIHWKEKSVDAYLPVFLGGEMGKENVEKRLRLLYFRADSDIVKLRWNYRNEENGYWMLKCQEYHVLQRIPTPSIIPAEAGI